MEDELKTYYDPRFGLASSGGGIRSCSFASGVLCALLHHPLLKQRHGDDERKYIPSGLPKYLSCVSGGGYMGSSFLSWARVNPGDPRIWAAEYFRNMSKSVGYYVSFELGPVRAIGDLLMMINSITFMLTVAVLINTPLGIFLAIALDYVFGDLLRSEHESGRRVYATCFFVAVGLIVIRSFAQRLIAPTKAESEGAEAKPTKNGYGSVNQSDEPPEFDPTKTNLKTLRMMFGDVLLGLLLMLMILDLIVFLATGIFHTRVVFGEFGEVQVLGSVIIAVLFHMMAGKLLQISQHFGVSIGYFLILWLYAEFANDQIYATLLPEGAGGFTLKPWYPTLQLVAAVLVMCNPILFFLQTTSIPFYSISRLTNAFYAGELQPGYCNTKAITGDYPADETMYGEDGPQNNLPVYIACTTANSWRITKKKADMIKAQAGAGDLPGAFDIYAISSDRKTQRLEDGMFGKPFPETSVQKLENDTSALSYLMGLSAAAGALQNGEYQSTFSSLGLSNLQLFLGASMGGFFFPYRKRNHKSDQPWCVGLVQLVVQGFLFGPLLFGSVQNQIHGGNEGAFLVALSILFWVLAFSCSSLLDRCDVEWIRYLAGGLQFRILTQQVAWNSRAPECLYLSDGGHTENLALLPLLARRVPVILIADGSADVDPVAGIRDALRQARSKLGVTFEPSRKDQLRRRYNKEDPSTYDLESDLTRFGRELDGDENRAFVIKARYHTGDCGSSMIIFLKPNPFNTRGPGKDTDHYSDALDHHKLAEEGLECGCSASCCSLTTCGSCCGKFPVVSTANQFFTPNLWLKMHQQGYAAAIEALDILAARRD